MLRPCLLLRVSTKRHVVPLFTCLYCIHLRSKKQNKKQKSTPPQKTQFLPFCFWKENLTTSKLSRPSVRGKVPKVWASRSNSTPQSLDVMQEIQRLATGYVPWNTGFSKSLRSNPDDPWMKNPLGIQFGGRLDFLGYWLFHDGILISWLKLITKIPSFLTKKLGSISSPIYHVRHVYMYDPRCWMDPLTSL